MKKFYVIGHPVAHSLSPKIHAMFAEQCGEEIDYQSIDFEPGSFIESLGRLRREQNPYGANITLPFKKDAADYCRGKRQQYVRICWHFQKSPSHRTRQKRP